MIFLIYLIHCVLQPAKHVFGDDDFHRFIVEDGYKAAIFGSYSYDPVKQVFDPSPAKNTSGAAHGSSTLMSTKMGGGGISTTEIVPSHNSTHDTPEARLRHRMEMIAAQRSSRAPPTTHWWARAINSSPTTKWQYKNLTSLLKNMI